MKSHKTMKKSEIRHAPKHKDNKVTSEKLGSNTRKRTQQCNYDTKPNKIKLPSINCSEQKHVTKSHQYLNVDCNWKALNETLPKTDRVGQQRRKRKLKNQASPMEFQQTGELEEDVWFDDVDPMLLEPSNNLKQRKLSVALVDEEGTDGLTKHVAVDCEMVGVGYKGQESILARVSIVNEFGKCVYDKYVKPREKVTDYRTDVSGIKAHHIQSGEEFQDVQREVADIFKDRIIVGHALSNDLKVLFLGHPRRKVRDTSDYKPFRRLNKGSKPSLKKLAQVILNKTIQAGQHDSIEDACVAMKLYMLNRKEWERSNKSKGVLKQTKYFCTNDSKSIKDEKRRKIKIFKIRNLQKKRR